jgi:Holliday junction resolvase RusA-like endonuclease
LGGNDNRICSNRGVLVDDKMTEIKITLPGSIRSKKNSKRIFARGRFKTVLPSKAYCEWESKVRSALNSVVRPIEYLLFCPLWVEAHIYYKGQQPDLSGALESIGDALEGLVWVNDKQIMSWDGSRLYHDLDNPRTEITVRWDETQGG